MNTNCQSWNTPVPWTVRQAIDHMLAIARQLDVVRAQAIARTTTNGRPFEECYQRSLLFARGLELVR